MSHSRRPRGGRDLLYVSGADLSRESGTRRSRADLTAP